MDAVDDVVKTIRRDPDVINAKFSNSLLNTIGEICNRHGYGAARLFLMGKQEHEAKVLSKILNLIEEKGISRDIGTLIFKKMNAIKFAKEVKE